MKIGSKLIGLSLTLSMVPAVALANWADSVDLSGPNHGTKLGETYYGPKLGQVDRPAVRIYLHADSANPGWYYGVVSEYAGLVQVGEKYFKNRKAPKWSAFQSEFIHSAYLNHIMKRIDAFHVRPTTQPGLYNMYELRVVGSEIRDVGESNPRQLKIALDAPKNDPLAGAKIFPGSHTLKHGGIRAILHDAPEPEINFPAESKKRGIGLQLRMCRLAYKKANLLSTWWNNFLPGPFLAAYTKANDEVLHMNETSTGDTATFKRSPKNSPAGVFTNAKSTYLTGTYRISRPIEGMFVLTTQAGERYNGAQIVTPRIALFIDFFDASLPPKEEKVVELAVINPSDPEDFLMYYETADNAFPGHEGEKAHNDTINAQDKN